MERNNTWLSAEEEFTLIIIAEETTRLPLLKARNPQLYNDVMWVYNALDPASRFHLNIGMYNVAAKLKELKLALEWLSGTQSIRTNHEIYDILVWDQDALDNRWIFWYDKSPEVLRRWAELANISHDAFRATLSRI